MRKDKALVEGKRLELEELFETKFEPRQIEEMATTLWQFASEKFGRDKQGAVFLAFLNCADRCMLHIVAKAQADSGLGPGSINPTQKRRVTLQ